MEKKLTCIVCPMGCEILVEFDGKTVKSVSGNNCSRGKEYVQNECTNPKRTVTTTMKCSDGSLLSVKTDVPIPKDEIFRCMAMINSTVALLPVRVGDVLIDGVFGARVVATQNKGENV